MIKKLQALKAKKGFTLVELIVVIAIIGVLAAILIPTLSGVIESARKRSAESTCQSIQGNAKTFDAQLKAIVGKSVKAATDKVDMDTGDGELTIAQYIYLQIPELQSTDNKAVCIEVDTTKGGVIGVAYREGDYIAAWTTTGGTVSAVNLADAKDNSSFSDAAKALAAVDKIEKESSIYFNKTAVKWTKPGAGDKTPDPDPAG